MAENVILSQEELAGLCGYYSRLLKLQDWQISVKLANQTEVGVENDAEVSYSRVNRIATVKIVKPDQWEGAGVGDYFDMEECLAHELVHLALWFWDVPRDNRPLHSLYEQGIHALAQALVIQRRRYAAENVKRVVLEDEITRGKRIAAEPDTVRFRAVAEPVIDRESFLCECGKRPHRPGCPAWRYNLPQETRVPPEPELSPERIADPHEEDADGMTDGSRAGSPSGD